MALTVTSENGELYPMQPADMNGKRVLVVDDEPVVLNALKVTLEREGFPVVACTSPRKALAIVADRDFAVIISDQRMPEMMIARIKQLAESSGTS